ncbi:MAG: hypothetical protein MUF48_10985, partial [Pirellulaceae bacterium]|nr:hypothetical protein [Pirellulaceae bacterium]
VRALIALRHRYAALRTGEYCPLLAEGPHYALLRRDATDTLLVVLNISESQADIHVPVQPHVPDGEQLVTVFGGDGNVVAIDGRVRLRVSARSGMVLRAATHRTESSSGKPSC